MPEQVRETANDCKSEPQPAHPIALGIADLVELLENPLTLGSIDAGPAVPYFNRDAIAAAPGTNDHPAALSVA